MLLEQVWGYRHAGDTRLVNVHVQRLRSKIEHDPEHPEIVVTVRGVGYKAGRPDRVRTRRHRRPDPRPPGEGPEGGDARGPDGSTDAQRGRRPDLRPDLEPPTAGRRGPHGPAAPSRAASSPRPRPPRPAACRASCVRRWRQSLRLRVVTTTMALGLVVVSLLGGLLHEQIANGLENDRVDRAEYEALALTGQAQTYWDNSTSTSVDELNQAARDIMSRILTAPEEVPSRYVVMSRSRRQRQRRSSSPGSRAAPSTCPP